MGDLPLLSSDLLTCLKIWAVMIKTNDILLKKRYLVYQIQKCSVVFQGKQTADFTTFD